MAVISPKHKIITANKNSTLGRMSGVLFGFCALQSRISKKSLRLIGNLMLSGDRLGVRLS